MKKTLTAIALAGSLLFSLTTNTQGLETDSKKPYEQIKKYLDKGMGKEEFRFAHNLFVDKRGNLHYNRFYDFEGKEFIEQYDMTNILLLNKDGKSHVLFVYPSAFYFKGIWYLDPSRDGFNGNEIKIDNLKKFVKPKLGKNPKVNNAISF